MYSNIVPPHDMSVARPWTLVTRRPEVEPVMLGHVAFGDRDETGQPRLRRQEIVERAVQAPRAVCIGEAVAD